MYIHRTFVSEKIRMDLMFIPKTRKSFGHKLQRQGGNTERTHYGNEFNYDREFGLKK